jgi:hypothetical protein
MSKLCYKPLPKDIINIIHIHIQIHREKRKEGRREGGERDREREMTARVVTVEVLF